MSEQVRNQDGGREQSREERLFLVTAVYPDWPEGGTYQSVHSGKTEDEAIHEAFTEMCRSALPEEMEGLAEGELPDYMSREDIIDVSPLEHLFSRFFERLGPERAGEMLSKHGVSLVANERPNTGGESGNSNGEASNGDV